MNAPAISYGRPLPMRAVIYSTAGTDLHGALCDGFLAHQGWISIDGQFFEIMTMVPGWGAGGRFTRWMLRQAPAGSA